MSVVIQQGSSPEAPGRQGPSSRLHRFAILTSGATLCLIFIGGLVTSTGSGLAVPDWPLSYGQLFPRMVGGVLYEHGHRMAAATVGLLTTILACWVFLTEKRRSVAWLAAAALIAVVLQGVLGGVTVLLLLPPAVSVAHACLAQAFLCLTVALAVVTGPGWRPAGDRPRPVSAGDRPLRWLAIALAGAVYAQLILGAVMRHTGAGLAIPDFPLAFGHLIPPLTSPGIAIHFAHRVWALVVAALGIAALARTHARHRSSPWLRRPAAVVACLIVLQIALGALTVWTSRGVIPTTAHVACGASILAASLVLALRAQRLSAAGPTTSLSGRREAQPGWEASDPLGAAGAASRAAGPA